MAQGTNSSQESKKQVCKAQSSEASLFQEASAQGTNSIQEAIVQGLNSIPSLQQVHYSSCHVANANTGDNSASKTKQRGGSSEIRHILRARDIRGNTPTLNPRTSLGWAPKSTHRHKQHQREYPNIYTTLEGILPHVNLMIHK